MLNHNYEPLNVCQIRRAIVLILNGKAEVLETDSGVIRSPSFSMISPSVIRLAHLVRRPRSQAKLTRKRVFVRDRHTCQYCGKHTWELTLDHVIPRHKGGEHAWGNVVSACKTCNQKKASYTPKEAGMKLLKKPCQPSLTSDYCIYHLHIPEEWQKYLAFFAPIGG